ncbi:MAG: hypothetical protein P4L99_23460 [Chthoniobacter sp.]|nr:hypothetical protein [Chthoniobacter sp.]
MNLISEEVIRALEERLGDWRGRLPGNYNQPLMDDPRFGRALLFYLLLTENGEALPAQVSPEAIFWSRYYWFKRFLHTYETCVKKNAGMEQQAFQILEYPWPPCEPDWADLETVDRAAVEAAARDLSAASGMPDGLGGCP